MRTSMVASVAAGFAAALLLTPIAAFSATLIPVVPFPGSTSTTALGISLNNTITGPWIDSGGIEHGFFGTIAGAYTSFDYTGNTAMGTEPRGVNNKNLIVGYGPTDGSGSYVFGPQFEYNTATATMTTITEAGTPLDGIAQSVNKTGRFAGDHWVPNGDGTYTRYGYLGKNGVWVTDLSVFGSNRVAARGVSENGIVVGFFLGSDGFTHGFIQQNHVVTQVDFPDPNEQDTYLEGVNDKGLVTGEWDDNSGSGLFMAFELNTITNTFTSITVSGATTVQAFGVNNAGLIALTSDAGNFIYCPKKPTACPGGNAREIADGPSITVPAGGHLRYAGHASPLRNNAPVRHIAGPLP